MPLCGDTSTIVHNYLAPYYREQPILFQELTYDLNEGMKVYEHAIRKIIMQIEKCYLLTFPYWRSQLIYFSGLPQGKSSSS
jgi:hypothetical protein